MDPHRIQIVGAGVENVARAHDYYLKLAQVGSADGDVIPHLDLQIGTALANLERCIEGHDSFDALAFLRLAAGPFDLTGFKESETLIETSQSAQDVVALAFLGLGLPRTPLTGENSGQPDIGAVVRHAAEIIRAAEARAMIQGHRLKEPLGPLAGEFLVYEMSVRGRQYESVAAELNDELLGDETVETILETTLGFTLAQVREVRAAAVDLLNERFFGARDRVGDAVRAAREVGDSDRDAFLADINLMLNECRLFGAVSPSDVARRTGGDIERVARILEYFSAKRPGDDPHPVAEFVAGRRPTPWGAIADGDSYLILNGFLGEDELRRDLERGLIAASQGGGLAAKNWAKYDRRRAAFAETKAAATITSLLGGTLPEWQGQVYLGPEDPSEALQFGRDRADAADTGREYESDVLFLVDGVALCVEVKAGSVTDKARSGHAQRLATDLEKTLKDGNEQAQRLAALIRTNGGVWRPDGTWIDLSGAHEVHAVIVMLDDMGPLSLSMNELAEKGVITSDEVPWIVSLHDLAVVRSVLRHPAQFLDFLRRRRGRRLATMLSGADELDVLMWFVDGGMYFDPDPVDVAQQLPVDRPIRKTDQQRFDQQPRVRLGTLTDPLDAWMYAEQGLSQAAAPRPSRSEEPWVEEFLDASEQSRSPGWLRFGADLVGLSGRAQQKIGRDLRSQCRAARGGVLERSLTTHGTTSAGPWLLTAAAIPADVETGHLPRYIDAKQYQTRASRSMLLLYRTDGTLYGSRFRGSPEPRSDERDAEISVSPLRSLASTFSAVPPSARRKTKQLRGKRTKRTRK